MRQMIATSIMRLDPDIWPPFRWHLAAGVNVRPCGIMLSTSHKKVMNPLQVSIIRRVALLALPFLVLLLSGCELRLRGTTVAEMDAAETTWQENPILDYHIVVEVKRPDELRRNDVTVRGGEVSEATMVLSTNSSLPIVCNPAAARVAA